MSWFVRLSDTGVGGERPEGVAPWMGTGGLGLGLGRPGRPASSRRRR